MVSLVKLVATAFLGMLPRNIGEPSSRQALADSHAMNHYGKFEIVRSNDPKVNLLPAPVVVDIQPGRFNILGAAVHGSFRFEPELSSQRQGIFVSMTPFCIRLLRETYQMVPLATDRLGLFGQGRHKSRYYILERSSSSSSSSS